MEHPNLTREELIQILVADRYGQSALSVPFICYEIFSRELLEQHNKLLFHVSFQLTEAVAERLLDQAWEGPLLTPAFVRQVWIQTEQRFRTYRFTGVTDAQRDRIVAYYIDLVLSVGVGIDFDETHSSRWDRITTIHTLAASHRLSCIDFLTRVDSALDWILRLVSTPHLFRQSQQAYMDARHPELLSRRMSELEQLLTSTAGCTHRVQVEVVNENDSNAYWMWRAHQIQAMEQRIERVWPGQALGSTHTPPDHA